MTEASQEDPLLTYDDIAEMLGVARGTVQNRINEGDWDIPKVKFGYQTIRFRKSAVDRFIEDRESESAA